MREIELKKKGVNSLESIYLDNKNNFKGHYTGNQIKLLPFKTNPSGDEYFSILLFSENKEKKTFPCYKLTVAL